MCHSFRLDIQTSTLKIQCGFFLAPRDGQDVTERHFLALGQSVTGDDRGMKCWQAFRITEQSEVATGFLPIVLCGNGEQARILEPKHYH